MLTVTRMLGRCYRCCPVKLCRTARWVTMMRMGGSETASGGGGRGKRDDDVRTAKSGAEHLCFSWEHMSPPLLDNHCSLLYRDSTCFPPSIHFISHAWMSTCFPLFIIHTAWVILTVSPRCFVTKILGQRRYWNHCESVCPKPSTAAYVQRVPGQIWAEGGASSCSSSVRSF